MSARTTLVQVPSAAGSANRAVSCSIWPRSSASARREGARWYAASASRTRSRGDRVGVEGGTTATAGCCAGTARPTRRRSVRRAKSTPIAATSRPSKTSAMRRIPPALAGTAPAMMRTPLAVKRVGFPVRASIASRYAPGMRNDPGSTGSSVKVSSMSVPAGPWRTWRSSPSRCIVPTSGTTSSSSAFTRSRTRAWMVRWKSLPTGRTVRSACIDKSSTCSVRKPCAAVGMPQSKSAAAEIAPAPKTARGVTRAPCAPASAQTRCAHRTVPGTLPDETAQLRS